MLQAHVADADIAVAGCSAGQPSPTGRCCRQLGTHRLSKLRARLPALMHCTVELRRRKAQRMLLACCCRHQPLGSALYTTATTRPDRSRRSGGSLVSGTGTSLLPQLSIGHSPRVLHSAYVMRDRLKLHAAAAGAEAREVAEASEAAESADEQATSPQPGAGASAVVAAERAAKLAWQQAAQAAQSAAEQHAGRSCAESQQQLPGVSGVANLGDAIDAAVGWQHARLWRNERMNVRSCHAVFILSPPHRL